MKKRGGPPQPRAEVKLPSTQWIPGIVAIEYLQHRLGYLPASVAELLRSALRDGQVKIRFDKHYPAMPYGHDHQTIEGATVRDLFFERASLKVWADTLALGDDEQDVRKTPTTTKFQTSEETFNAKSAESLKKMVIGMAIAKYGYDPTAERSKATAVITEDLARLGLSLDPDTVRRWLREAADCLPRTDVADL